MTTDSIMNGQKTRPGRCPEQELIAQRPLVINQAREVFWQGRFPAPLIYPIMCCELIARCPVGKGNPVALVAYETSTEKVSLLVASAKSVVVAGGEEVRSGNLTFHYRSEANFEVITWANHGLAYALVSSSMGSPQHSCLVCHQNMADQNLVKQ